MSFDLKIQFVGLMTWVPEGVSAMHVLLPATGEDAGNCSGSASGTNGGCIEEHFLRIIYDVAYQTPGSKQLRRTYNMIDLKGGVLDLSEVKSVEGLVSNLPDELPLLNDLAGPVIAKLVTDPPAGPLGARVTMRSGVLSDYAVNANFKFKGKDEIRRMTDMTEWTIRGLTVEAEPGKLGLPALELKLDKRLPKLYPIGQTIHLMVFNTIRSEFPPKGPLFDPFRDGFDQHFQAYLTLCTSNPGNVILNAADKGEGEPIYVTGDLVEQPETSADPSAICVQARGHLV